MKKLMSKLTIMLAVLLVFSLSATAAQLDSALVPADAQWVLHFDMEGFGNSQLKSLILDGSDFKELDDAKSKAMKEFNIDLEKAIGGVTIFGNDKNHEDIVLICKGSFDSAKILAKVKKEIKKESKKGSKNPLVEKRYGKHIIYKLDNDGFGVLSDRFFVYAKKEADIKNTLDVLNGKKKNSGSSDLMANLKKMPKRAFLVAAAADISELGKEAPGKMLSNAGVATFMAMENNKNLALRALLNTGSADDARNIENVAKGLMSLANMKIEGEFKQYLELLNGIDFRSEGAVLNVGFEYPIEKLVKMLKEAKSCKHKHGSKHKHDHEDHDHEKEA